MDRVEESIKQKQRYKQIANLRNDERWKAMVDELEYQERQAFEGLLNGVGKDEVVGMVIVLRRIKGLPEQATQIIQREGID